MKRERKPYDLTELLSECVDALTMPQHDGGERDVHISMIEQAFEAQSLNDETKALLESAVKIFRGDFGKDSIQFSLSDNSHRYNLAAEIERALTGPLYVYHGTIYGRLKSIAKSGLKPGEKRVWQEKQVPEEYLKSAVFFEATWRKALDWATITQMRSRGPKDGLNRLPIVIRIPRKGLSLEPDTIALSRGALKTGSPVPLTNPKVILGKTSGYPYWLSLDAALDSAEMFLPKKSESV